MIDANEQRSLCAGCDTLLSIPEQSMQALGCPICKTPLSSGRHQRSTSQALTVTLAVLIAAFWIFPFMRLELYGNQQIMTLATAIISLANSHEYFIAFLLALTLGIAPLLEVLALLNLLLLPPSASGFRRYCFRTVYYMRHWNMIEVCGLGVMIAGVKLTDYAEVIPGPALFAMFAMMLIAGFMNAGLNVPKLASRI